MEAQFTAILADAATQYAEKAGSKQVAILDDFTSISLKSVEQLKAQIDAQNNQFSNFRAKRQSLFKALTLAMVPIEVVGEAAAGAAAEMFPASTHVFSAVMYLIKAAENVSAVYDSIEELFDQLKDFTGRLQIYVKYKMSDTLREKLVSILASVFGVLIIATHEVRNGRFKSYLKRLVGFGHPVKNAVEKLEGLIASEERLIVAETYGGVVQIGNKTDKVEEIVTQVNENLQNLSFDHLGQMDIARRDRLRNILQPSPFPKDFFTAFDKSRVSGTGEWLLEDESLQSWFKGEKPFLWMNGSPGTGKSFLTANMISWSCQHLPRTAYFFFRDNNPETRSVVQALRDVAYQMSEGDANYAKALTNSLYSSDDIRTVASAFRRLFIEPFQTDISPSPTYVFLDGIDEADTEEMTQLLFQLGPDADADADDVTSRPKCSSLLIALVGRSYMTDPVVSALDRDSTGDLLLTILITPDRSAADVSAYIARGISQSRILNQTTPDFRDQVVQMMESKVDGLFILAKFMLAEINRKRHPRSILKSLETYPKEINGMLEKTLESLSASISEEEAEDLNEMLRWIICAEEALTLEQLEAALILHFGDPPFRLEESIRGQYSCFFELEREDGMTTDDLIKDYERRQKGKRAGSPMSPRLGPTGGRISLSGSAVSDRGLSPLRHAFTSRNPSISSISSISSRERRGSGSPASPTRSVDLLMGNNEMDFRSKKSTTVVTFFHATVREFFLNLSTSEHPQPISSRIKFDPVEARYHVLQTCLRIFTDKAWFEGYDLGQGRRAMKQYAAWYWQEHLACLDPAMLKTEDKRQLATALYRMLTEDAIILDWTIMYKKNDEGQEVLTEQNTKSLHRWFQDADIISALDDSGKAFANSIKDKPSKLCEAIGRFYARCWLATDCDIYLPTVFCFDIVQTVALMQEGYMWTQVHDHWAQIAVDDRIAKATEWAAFEQTGHWYRRVGSTYLSLGKHDKALEYYEKALKIDGNRQQSLGRIAYCLTKDQRYTDALEPALECVTIEEKSIAEGKYTGTQLDRSKWRLYKDYLLAADCYDATSQFEKAFQYYEKAISAGAGVELNEWELFESEIAYLEALSKEHKYQEMIILLQEMSLQLTKKTKGQNRLVEMVLHQYNKPLILDRIPKAAAKAQRTPFILQTLEHAIAAADDLRDPVVMLYLRLAFGKVCVYSYGLDQAIEMFEQMSLIEYRTRGPLLIQQGHSISFQELAHLYKLELLHMGASNPLALVWIYKLEAVMKKQEEQRGVDTPASIQGSDINRAAIFLGLFYRLLGKSTESKAILGSLIKDNLELLSDTEPQNDEFALDNLLWLLLAAGDMDKATCLALSMRQVNPNASLAAQSESPVLERSELKLPVISSADRCCAQCLEDIPPTDAFGICALCMECYCQECLDKVIRVPGNATADKRVGIRCRNDHNWLNVPTLNRALHAGQIVGTDDNIREFATWTGDIRREWSLDREAGLAA